MLLAIHPDNPDPRKLAIVVECLLDGGIIIYPTDTVYSIGCSILKPKAMERVAKLKGIAIQKANFSIICYDLSNISNYTKAISTPIYKLLRRTLPGPYTYILNGNNQIPRIFLSKKKTIGIRIPDNNIARAIVKEIGNPIIATSVYDEDEIIEYTTDPELIYEKYANKVDIVINGGYGHNEASTVIDCTSENPKLIRQGIGEVDFI